jgi:hypothetical protein
MNKWRIKSLAAAVLLCGASWQASAAGLYVICNSGLSIAPDAVKAIFLGETQFSGSVKLEPTDNAAAQAAFLGKVMGMEKDKYDAVWVKKSFRDGITQPPSRAMDAEVVDFVKKTPGGVGYVATEPVGVKIIQQY